MRLGPLDVLLIIVLIATSVGMIVSRYHARKLYFSITQQQAMARDLDVQFGQLQLEEATDSMRFHLQKIAQQQLGLQPPRVTKTVQLRPVLSR